MYNIYICIYAYVCLCAYTCIIMFVRYLQLQKGMISLFCRHYGFGRTLSCTLGYILKGLPDETISPVCP